MKEVYVQGDKESWTFKTEIKDVPKPTPKDNEVLIKVVVAGTNPKDWKVPLWMAPQNIDQGDDVAGVVDSVGKDVTEFKQGDRVAAFHVMLAPHGAWAEYSVAPSHTTFHIPAKTSFEEAATLPLAYMTAAIGLYDRLLLPMPWAPTSEPIPLIVWGGSSAVGAFAIKLAKLSKTISPLIVVAGAGTTYVESLIDKSVDKVVDYRSGDVVAKLREALGGKKCLHAYDAVSDHGSFVDLSKVLEKGGKITVVLPGKEYPGLEAGVETILTMVGTSHNDQEQLVGSNDFAHAMFRFLGRALERGIYSGHPYEVVPGGLEGIDKGLRNLEAGKASAIKYVYRISETPGLSSS